MTVRCETRDLVTRLVDEVKGFGVVTMHASSGRFRRHKKGYNVSLQRQILIRWGNSRDEYSAAKWLDGIPNDVTHVMAWCEPDGVAVAQVGRKPSMTAASRLAIAVESPDFYKCATHEVIDAERKGFKSTARTMPSVFKGTHRRERHFVSCDNQQSQWRGIGTGGAKREFQSLDQ